MRIEEVTIGNTPIIERVDPYEIIEARRGSFGTPTLPPGVSMPASRKPLRFSFRQRVVAPRVASRPAPGLGADLRRNVVLGTADRVVVRSCTGGSVWDPLKSACRAVPPNVPTPAKLVQLPDITWESIWCGYDRYTSQDGATRPSLTATQKTKRDQLCAAAGPVIIRHVTHNASLTAEEKAAWNRILALSPADRNRGQYIAWFPYPDKGSTQAAYLLLRYKRKDVPSDWTYRKTWPVDYGVDPSFLFAAGSEWGVYYQPETQTRIITLIAQKSDTTLVNSYVFVPGGGYLASVESRAEGWFSDAWDWIKDQVPLACAIARLATVTSPSGSVVTNLVCDELSGSGSPLLPPPVEKPNYTLPLLLGGGLLLFLALK